VDDNCNCYHYCYYIPLDFGGTPLWIWLRHWTTSQNVAG
jgi:hypothetical protein